MTWTVTCPNWNSEAHQNAVQSWTFFELTKVKDYSSTIIKCNRCQHSFNLIEGVRESFISDNPFVIHDFQSNAETMGVVEGKVGLLKTITFKRPFDEPPVVYVTAFTPTSLAISGVHTKGFSLHSSKLKDTDPDNYRCSWTAYGIIDDSKIPLWRKVIINAKNGQLKHDFRLELVELESAFEVFLYDYVITMLKNKGLREDTIAWISRRNVDELLSVWFYEATGKKPSDVFGTVHVNWSTNVKQLRDKVVHRGSNVTKDQIKSARGAVFDYIMAIDGSAIEFFKIRMNDTTPPNMKQKLPP